MTLQKKLPWKRSTITFAVLSLSAGLSPMEGEEDEASQLNRLRAYFLSLQQHLLGINQEEEQEEEQEDDLIPARERDEILDDLLEQRVATDIIGDTMCHPKRKDKPVHRLLYEREYGIVSPFHRSYQRHVVQRYLPRGKKVSAEPSRERRARGRMPISEAGEIIDEHENQVFCGQFGSDGNVFMSACQDRNIRLYDTRTWDIMKVIQARDVGWSIIDTDYSPDQRFLIYSSWSDYIHLCNIYGEEEVHEPLDLRPESRRFCVFSVKFSHSSNEIVAGSSDGCLYVYDLDQETRTLKIQAHTDDVNTVCFADDTSQVLISGSDDTLCKVWDRRTLGRTGKPVGVMIGHLEGITHISSKDDGRYFISNSKDQSIKLWDLRKMRSRREAKGKERASNWDYRYGDTFFGTNMRKVFSGKLVHPDDTALMTYRGHRVFQTLIRSYFSPSFCTGQKYIYTGSYDGAVYVFDVLTGDIVTALNGHMATVRDVSWHPHQPCIVSSSAKTTNNMAAQQHSGMAPFNTGRLE